MYPTTDMFQHSDLFKLPSEYFYTEIFAGLSKNASTMSSSILGVSIVILFSCFFWAFSRATVVISSPKRRRLSAL